MNSYIVVTKTVIHRSYEIEATSSEAATAMFGPYVDVEDDGSILDENGEEVISPDFGETSLQVLECRLENDGNGI